MSTKRPACEDHDISPGHSEKKFKGSESEGARLVMSQQKRGNGDYTVGWICAISTEYIAAQAFLDKAHNPPESVPQNDNNNYTLGEIGKHNVVIAVLPKGRYGTTSAASVARDMLRTFPNVRIGLMVGIGGGAPSRKHDIRLGDIVVSTPYDREGGVFQYDFGKAIQDKEFKVTGHLNQPPIFLTTAVSGLEAQYKLHGHHLEEAIKGILEKKPRLRKEFKRPDPKSDRLYLSGFTHPADVEATCADECGDDPSRLVIRSLRTQDDDNPAVYYGTVASANQLMKNALLRDKFAKENGVLCFEMEAAGLMDHFPCLVIRGICDYSDTHKNNDWQGYAAIAAAAYAKDLLARIPVNKLEAEKRISEVLSSIEQNVYEARCDVKDLALEQRRIELDHWLSPPVPSKNHNEALKQHQKGTGSWFLQSDAFVAWKSQRNSFLWLYGIPGCGKTILSSTIIENLRSLSIQPLLYFYFDFNHTKKQTLRGVVCSLISQLYYTCNSAQEPLNALFSSYKDKNTQPSCESLCKVLREMIEKTEEIWIVLDAIDECVERKGSPTEGLLLWIRDLVKLEQKNVHCLVTSRPEQDIQSEMSNLVSEKNRISIQSDLVNDDILAYICARVREGEGLKRWRDREDVQKEIEEELAHKANGMFRWVRCQIDALEVCLDYPTLRTALDSLPKTLDETYARILNTIPDSHKQPALRILQFLTFSERPLRIEEAVDALAVNVDKSPHFSPKNRMPDPQEITRYCSSLVTVVSVKGKDDLEHVQLQLAHFSVKEYLTSDRLHSSTAHGLREAAARLSIARVCLSYLLQFDRLVSLEKIRKGFPFAEYSAMFWMSNARVAACESKLMDLVERLFCYQESSYSICYSLYRPDELWHNHISYRSKPASPLYYAAFGGLRESVRLLLDKDTDINAQGGYYGNALQAASFEGHEQLVKLLLDKGADINAQGGGYGNALQAASFEGHEQLVKLLLDKGADVNAQGGDYGNALQAASEAAARQGRRRQRAGWRLRQRAPGGFRRMPRAAGEAAAQQGRRR
ncbi:hypothetical protein K458DRAFT_435608 [Lentithecium fluviatile CBS 122367]|uniref:NACHT domain-containing protein n=1 Tax=Lentithecium fluviatile CBS 122367 TaxID=1168545 RepID=A0A6G1ILE8_9PLEO|nr:hypothetical protein K458DRAFT_435608 [Lentithecium fluviatile CBS 122367]